MSVLREKAMVGARRVAELVAGRVAGDYLQGDLMADATAMADYLNNAQPAADREPDNPVSPEFLELIGLTDPTGGGRVWVTTDVDARELKFLFDGQNGEPEVQVSDEEGDGCRLPAPHTEGDFIDLCRLLGFPVEIPV